MCDLKFYLLKNKSDIKGLNIFFFLISDVKKTVNKGIKARNRNNGHSCEEMGSLGHC